MHKDSSGHIQSEVIFSNFDTELMLLTNGFITLHSLFVHCPFSTNVSYLITRVQKRLQVLIFIVDFAFYKCHQSII